jgi:hypothetical protein
MIRRMIRAAECSADALLAPSSHTCHGRGARVCKTLLQSSTMPGTAAVMRCSATMELMFDVRMDMAFWRGVGCLHWGRVSERMHNKG